MDRSPEQALAGHVAAVRRFSRFYTRRIGVVRDKLLDSALTLPEARVVYELAQRPRTTATALGAELSLDAGYLSRLLRRLEKRGLIRRQRSRTDGRQSHVSLTPEGRRTFRTLDRRSRKEIAEMLQALPGSEQSRLVRAMETVEAILGEGEEALPSFTLRTHRPGDMGWIVHRQALLYAREYGWDETFEALVAEIVAQFVRRHDPARERCWIAEHRGEIAGSVFLVAESDTEAKLRLLYVEPAARNLGIGGRLVNECVSFARAAGYETLTLWTNDVLSSARRLYERAGFRLVREERHVSFGKALTGQYWALELGA